MTDKRQNQKRHIEPLGKNSPNSTSSSNSTNLRAQNRQSEIQALLKKIQELTEELKNLRQKSENKFEKAQEELQEVRDNLDEAKSALAELSKTPNNYGTILQINEPEKSTDRTTSLQTVDIYSSGKKMRVGISPDLLNDKKNSPQPGQEVLLNSEMNIIAILDEESSGEIVSLKEILDADRAIVVGRADDERVLEFSDTLKSQRSILKPGDSLLANLRSNILLERLPKPEVEELILEEIPDITYENVAGLDAQIEQIRDAVELPFIHEDLFAEHQLPAPKGILLYGPPGCGKTLIAKAVANSLANNLKTNNLKERSARNSAENVDVKNVDPKKDTNTKNKSSDQKPSSHFINIKGPELLNKYVGETERQIRLIFQRAREKSKDGMPVIVFFDEMESLFRMRGSGISSDMESTVVPQLLSEIDGLESLKNVIVIGASNREDLIDPAILRPGRLDVKIKIERPDAEAAQAIFACYLVEDLPIAESEIQEKGGGDKAKAVRAMIEKTVEEMYATAEQNRFLEVTYMNGDREVMYFKDFASGAMIENIVRRAKKIAIKRFLQLPQDTGGNDSASENEGEDLRGIILDDLLSAVAQEFREHEDLPNTTNPDDWAKISGKKGQRINFVRTLLQDEQEQSFGGKTIEQKGSGQYL